MEEVASGCAKGVDALGEQWATEREIPIKRFPTDWSSYGRAAGPKRNEQMAQYANALLAIPVPDSRGMRGISDHLMATDYSWRIKASSVGKEKRVSNCL